MFQVAGTMMVSFSLFTEVSSAHATGNSHSRASAMTTPVVARANKLVRWRGRPGRASRRPPMRGREAETAMSDSTLLAADQGQPDEGHDQDDDEQDERGRGRVADALAGERGVVDP